MNVTSQSEAGWRNGFPVGDSVARCMYVCHIDAWRNLKKTKTSTTKSIRWNVRIANKSYLHSQLTHTVESPPRRGIAMHIKFRRVLVVAIGRGVLHDLGVGKGAVRCMYVSLVNPERNRKIEISTSENKPIVSRNKKKDTKPLF